MLPSYVDNMFEPCNKGCVNYDVLKYVQRFLNGGEKRSEVQGKKHSSTAIEGHEKEEYTHRGQRGDVELKP
eukprot:1158743-Pelagomonas_calceolata.AAC.46